MCGKSPHNFMPIAVDLDGGFRELREPNSGEEGLEEGAGRLEGGVGRDCPRESGTKDTQCRVGEGYTSGWDRGLESRKQSWERGDDCGGESKGQGTHSAPNSAQLLFHAPNESEMRG